jgi:hypothetical protein
MRSHGVPNFPDPSPGGPSVIPNWIKPQAPAFRSAQKACAKYLKGSSGQASGSESEKLELLNLASACAPTACRTSPTQRLRPDPPHHPAAIRAMPSASPGCIS